LLGADVDEVVARILYRKTEPLIIVVNEAFVRERFVDAFPLNIGPGGR
jgi:hypothetical protein